MKLTFRNIGILCLPLLATAGGCKAKNSNSVTSLSKATTAVSQTAASVSAAMPHSSPTTMPGLTLETTSGLAGADWALKQDAINKDPNGQWAITASASSTYNDAAGHDEYSAFQATGAPNVETEADNGGAWSPKQADAGMEWLDLTYSKPVHATSVRIRESYNAGAIAKVDVYDEQGTVHTVWTGTDPTKGINYFILNLPKTEYRTNHLRLTLATNVVEGYNEIDAAQLVGTEQ